MDAFAKDAKAFADLVVHDASAKEVASAFKGLAKQCKSCHDRYRVESNTDFSLEDVVFFDAL